VQEYGERIRENVELGKEKVKEMTPGPLHEVGARVGLVEPTISEEIKFVAERMGTAGPTAEFNEWKESVKEKNEQVWTNVELGKEKVTEMTSEPIHELGARVGLVQPTMKEEIKFGAEKMGTTGPYATLNEIGVKTKENMDYGYNKLQEKSKEVWNNNKDKVKEYNEVIQENVKEITPGPIHELGARTGLVQPTMAEEIKFGAEKMGTATSTSKLNQIGEIVKDNVAYGVETAKGVTENVKEKSAQLWRATQESVWGLNEMVKENLEYGWEKMKELTPAPLHEVGARVGLVQPTMSEEIKFGAEKMGTAGSTASNEMKENVQETGEQVWNNEAPGTLHELGARVGLVEPTMSEEIKFGAEKMGTAGPSKLSEIGIKTKENMDYGYFQLKGATENLQEKGKEVWNKTQDVAHEHGARVGLVEPTMSEEIKFAAEKIGTGKELEMNVNLETGKRPTV